MWHGQPGGGQGTNWHTYMPKSTYFLNFAKKNWPTHPLSKSTKILFENSIFFNTHPFCQKSTKILFKNSFFFNTHPFLLRSTEILFGNLPFFETCPPIFKQNFDNFMNYNCGPLSLIIWTRLF